MRYLIAVAIVLAIFEFIWINFGPWNAFALVIAVALVALGVVLARKLLEVASRSVGTLRFGLRHMMLGIVLVAIAIRFGMVFGSSILIVGALLLPPLIVAAFVVSWGDRTSTQRDALLSVLAMAAREQMPLAPAVDAYAGLCKWPYRGRVQALANRLGDGASLPDALDAVPDVLPESAARVARVGWNSGTLDRALDEAAQSRNTERRYAPQWMSMIGYPIGVTLAVSLVGGFLNYFIGPKLNAIFRDFGVPLPWSGNNLLRELRAATYLWDLPSLFPWILGGSFVILILAWALRANGVLTAQPLSWLTKRRITAMILRALAVGVEGGRTITDILQELDRSETRRWVRKRLRLATTDIRLGKPWVKSLWGRGLVRPVEAAVLESAERAGNLPWALRELAKGSERRLNYRLRALGQVVQPVAVLALAGLVFTFAITYFYPLIVLINHLAETLP